MIAWPTGALLEKSKLTVVCFRQHNFFVYVIEASSSDFGGKHGLILLVKRQPNSHFVAIQFYRCAVGTRKIAALLSWEF